ncbi:MAG TPA: oligosaccharide flippase family protein [Noviherbaspirillum sp.]
MENHGEPDRLNEQKSVPTGGNLKHAMAASYAVQIYSALIGVVMMPVYLRYLGAESFGLVGFFAMLQTWLMLFDLGLTPTLSRQMACYKAGTLSEQALRELLRTLEWLFGALAAVTTLVGISVSSWVALKWLQLDHLKPDVVAACVAMMALMAGMKWMSGLYRSGLVGLEQQTLTNGINAMMTTGRFIGVLPWLMFVSASPLMYFSYQLAMFVIEFAIYWHFLGQRLGRAQARIRLSTSALKEVLPFAMSLALTNAIWIFTMNLDKLILSHFLSLRDYGYFSIAITVAGGILVLIAPVSQVILPRLTILFSQGREEQEIVLFREASQFAGGLMAAVSVNVAAFAQPLLLAWTGDADLAAKAAPILCWYAVGNGIVGVLTMPYLIQHASGNLRLHVLGNMIFSCLQIPCIFYAAQSFGAVGTGLIWVGANVLALLAWMPVVFRHYLQGLYFEWLTKDVLLLAAAAGLPVLLFVNFCTFSASRLSIAFELMLVGGVSLILAWMSGGSTRARLLGAIRAARS